MGLFNEALDNLFGLGGKFLQKEVLKTVCSKLGITYDLKNRRVRFSRYKACSW